MSSLLKIVKKIRDFCAVKMAKSAIDMNIERENAKRFRLNLLLELVRKYPVQVLPCLLIRAEDFELYSQEAVKTLAESASVLSDKKSAAAYAVAHLVGRQCEYIATLDGLCAYYQKLCRGAREISLEVIKNRILVFYKEESSDSLTKAVDFFHQVSKFGDSRLSFPIWKEVDLCARKFILHSTHSVEKLQRIIQELESVIVPYWIEPGDPQWAHVHAYHYAVREKVRRQRQAAGVTVETLQEGLQTLIDTQGTVDHNYDYISIKPDAEEIRLQVDRIIGVHERTATIPDRYDLLMELHWKVGYYLSKDSGSGIKYRWRTNSPLIDTANALLKKHPYKFADHPDEKIRQKAASYAS